MKVIVRSPALPLLVLGILFDVPVSRAKPKAGHDPKRSESEKDAGRIVSESGGHGSNSVPLVRPWH